MTSAEGGSGTDLLGALRRWWPLVLALTLIGALGLMFANSTRPLTYTSSANVIWQANGGQLVQGVEFAGGDDPARGLATQADVIQGDTVMQAAAEIAGVPDVELRTHTTVGVRPNSNVLTVSVEADSPEAAQVRAAAVVQAYVEGNRTSGTNALNASADSLQPRIDALSDQLTQLDEAAEERLDDDPDAPEDPTSAARRQAAVNTLTELTSQQETLRSTANLYQGQASVVSGASLPAEPSSMSRSLALVLGALLGLVLGLLLAVLLGARRSPRRGRTAQPAPVAAAPATTQVVTAAPATTTSNGTAPGTTTPGTTTPGTTPAKGATAAQPGRITRESV